MRSACLLVSTFALAALPAQSQTLVSESPIGVFLTTWVEQRHAVFGASTAIPEWMMVHVVSTSQPFAAASCSAYSQGARIVLLESADGFGPASVGTAQGTPQSASHFWRWLLSGPRNGELIGSCYGKLGGPSAFGVEVDIDADMTPEFTMQSPGSTPFRIPVQRASAFPVRVRTFGLLGSGVNLPASYSVSLTLAWVERGGATPVSFGPTDNVVFPCGGPELWATDVPVGMDHVLDFPLTAAFPNAPVVLVLGVQQTLVPLPGGSCFLELVPLVALPIVSNAQGAARWNLRVPGPLPSGEWFAQALTLDTAAASVRGSRGWRANFAD